MKKILQKTLTSFRYALLGKQIQKSLENAERAGREASDYQYQGHIRHLENNLKALEEKHEREVDQLVNKRIAEMDYTVNPDDVMTASARNGVPSLIFLGKNSLNEQEISNLKSEVILIKQTRLWKIMTETLKDQAQAIMFEKSKDFDDMRSGKMMLYNLGVMQNIMKTIEDFKL